MSRVPGAGEKRSAFMFIEPSEDPDALDPPLPGPYDGPPQGPFGPPPVPWYSEPPGGISGSGGNPGGARFDEGVPGQQHTINVFEHVVRGHAAIYNPGIFRGNTGFRSNGPNELGAVLFGEAGVAPGKGGGGGAGPTPQEQQDSSTTESAKTGMVGLFLLASAIGVFFLYKLPAGQTSRAYAKAG